MSIAISQDSSFKELSVSFDSLDIAKLREMVKDMRVVKVITKGGDLVLYQSYFKLIGITIHNEHLRPSLVEYIFTIRDTLNCEDYYLNLSFCDRVFFQKTTLLN